MKARLIFADTIHCYGAGNPCLSPAEAVVTPLTDAILAMLNSI